MWNAPKQKATRKSMPLTVQNARSFLRVSCMAGASFIAAFFAFGIEKMKQRVRGEAPPTPEDGEKVIIVGAGTAGSTLAATLSTQHPELKVVVMDPQKDHVFLAHYPLAAAGHRSYDLCTYGPNSLMNTSTWCVTREAELQMKSVSKVIPSQNEIVDENGVRHPYDYLVLAAGAKRDISPIKGLKMDMVDKHRICVNPHSIRDTLCVAKTGNVVCCKVAPRGEGALYARQSEGNHISTTNMVWKFLKFFGRFPASRFYTITEDMAPSDRLPADYNDRILSFWEKRGTEYLPGYRLESIDGPRHMVHLRHVKTGEKKKIEYKLLALDLPMKAPDFISASGLDSKGTQGFAHVDQETLQHHKYNNIFALGDCAALDNPKSYGAVFAQVPVVTHNVCQLVERDQQIKQKAKLAVDTDPAFAEVDSTASTKKTKLATLAADIAKETPLPELEARYNGYSSFHINMTTWRCMWPEVERGIKRVNHHIFDNSQFENLGGFLNGAYLQWAGYECMYWVLFLRGWWYPPKWFAYPNFTAEHAARLKELQMKEGGNNEDEASS